MAGTGLRRCAASHRSRLPPSLTDRFTSVARVSADRAVSRASPGACIESPSAAGWSRKGHLGPVGAPVRAADQLKRAESGLRRRRWGSHDVDGAGHNHPVLQARGLDRHFRGFDRPPALAPVAGHYSGLSAVRGNEEQCAMQRSVDTGCRGKPVAGSPEATSSCHVVPPSVVRRIATGVWGSGDGTRSIHQAC